MKRKNNNISLEMIVVKLNDKEFLADDKNRIKKFYTVKSAKLYLKSKGFVNFNGIDFVKESEVNK